ncbi:hypothetical protein CALCODRAFT_484549 [Calocera cornea HHB12733]|uniref:Uncharacterized protein n=1 Tax=Calocera cornea HHB12733 TaxID=1353952 RepID=A0A165EWK0_9BASI|nr:hypothetical protein CALCODRAFT_484549 [Calocera cornea HHB12733]
MLSTRALPRGGRAARVLLPRTPARTFALSTRRSQPDDRSQPPTSQTAPIPSGPTIDTPPQKTEHNPLGLAPKDHATRPEDLPGERSVEGAATPAPRAGK